MHQEKVKLKRSLWQLEGSVQEYTTQSNDYLCYCAGLSSSFTTYAQLFLFISITILLISVRATLAPCNCKLLQGLWSWGGVLIGSLLGLLIAKCEQPQAGKVFLLVRILHTVSAGKGNVCKEGMKGGGEIRENENDDEVYSEEHSLGSYTAIQEAKEILSCQIWGIT